MPGNTALLHLLLTFGIQKVEQIVPAGLIPLQNPLVHQEIAERTEIVPICEQGIPAQAAFDFQMFDKVFQISFHQ